MKFIMFVIDTKTASATPDEIELINAFNAKLEANGHWVLGVGLSGPASATTFEPSGKRSTSVQSTPFYSGFWVIEVADATQAELLAVEASIACNRNVELRQLL